MDEVRTSHEAAASPGSVSAGAERDAESRNHRANRRLGRPEKSVLPRTIGKSDAGVAGDDRTPDGVAEAEAHSVRAAGNPWG
jgi:hypothetical protein